VLNFGAVAGIAAAAPSASCGPYKAVVEGVPETLMRTCAAAEASPESMPASLPESLPESLSGPGCARPGRGRGAEKRVAAPGVVQLWA
jgi:hypothetical protein